MNVYIATMSTGHFEFMARGSSEEAAMDAMKKGFIRHLNQRFDGEREYAGRPGRPSLAEVHPPIKTARDWQAYCDEYFEGCDLDEWYGINVVSLADGDFVRDGDPV